MEIKNIIGCLMIIVPLIIGICYMIFKVIPTIGFYPILFGILGIGYVIYAMYLITEE